MAQSNALTAARRHNVDRVSAFQAELDRFAPNIEQALPAHVPIDKFKRVLVTAVATNPDLLYADRRTLYTSAIKCAVDGLMPDGRDAALVVYNTKIRMRNPNTGLDEEFRIDAVQYLPMVAGIKRRMRNSGEVVSVEAEIVCRRDHFRYSLGDNPFIEHEPPPLGEDRGEIVGAYAIIRLTNGGVIRDVMDRPRIERARGQSRSKDSLMWKTFYEEGCKKTVLKHASKDAPQSAELLGRLLDRDDEPPAAGEFPGLPAPEARRDELELEPVAAAAIAPEPDPEEEFAIIDLDGVEHIFHSAKAAKDALLLVLREAAKHGPERLAGAAESNRTFADHVRNTDSAISRELAEEYAALREAVPASSRGARRQGNDRPPPATPRGQTRASEPPAATGRDDAAPSGPAEPLSGDEESESEPPSEETGSRGALLIPPPIRGDKPDWRAWALALFLPKVRHAATTNEFAFLLGDNDENLQKARAVLTSSDRRELDRAIEEKWKELG